MRKKERKIKNEDGGDRDKAKERGHRIITNYRMGENEMFGK